MSRDMFGNNLSKTDSFGTPTAAAAMTTTKTAVAAERAAARLTKGMSHTDYKRIIDEEFAATTTKATATAVKVGEDYEGDLRVISIEDAEGKTLATLPYTDEGEAWANRIVRAVNRDAAFEVMVAALGYMPEQVDLTTPRYKDADDSDTVAIEVTVGWLREVRDALALAQADGGANELDYDASEPGHPDNPRSDYSVTRERL